MSKHRVVILIAIFVVAISGALFIWRSQETRAKTARIESEILKELTAEEIDLVLKNQALSDRAGVQAIAETTETRKTFLNAMREHLALAAAARREGLHEDPNFKTNLEYKKDLLLADIYAAKLAKAEGKDAGKYAVPRLEIEAVWKDSQNEAKFNHDMEALRTIQLAVARERGEQVSIGRLQGESLMRARENWARAKVISTKALNDYKFISRPEIHLRLRIMEAGILSSDYLRKHWHRIKATPEEIAAYLALHPEYDLKKKREKALLLLQRARAGEDFAKLAREFSEDRSSKEKGGLYEKLKQGAVWEEIESAALELDEGEVCERLVDSELGCHIVKLERKSIKKEKDGSERVEFSIRQILLQKSFEEPGITKNGVPPPFLKAEEIAKAAIEREKRNRFVEAAVHRNQISLPADFAVDLK